MMHRVSVVCGISLLTLALLPAVALAAVPRPGTHAVGALEVAHLLAPVRMAPASGAAAGPLRETAGAGASLHGSLTDSYGFAMVSSRVHWASPSGIPATGSALVDEYGAFAFTAVPAAAGNGDLWAVPEPDNGAWQRGRYGMTWADGGDVSVDLRAGRVGVGIYRGGPWYGWKNAVFFVWTKPADGNGTGFTMSTVRNTNVDGEGYYGEQPVEEGTGDGAVVYFWSNEGAEVPFSAEVQRTSPSVPSIAAYEDSACRARIMEPRWSSGKPGKTIILSLSGFDVGWINQIRGRSDYPGGATWKDLTRVTMRESGANLRVTIPSTAKPGYMYWVATDHVNGMAALRLLVPFQVATLRPSSTSVARGSTVRLSGVVPVDGHWGTKRGTPKTVVLYKGPNSQPQPRTWEPSRYDYTKVGSFRTDGYGRFRTSAVRVNGTTTFVVRYPGDATYWRAYTTQVLVKVK